MKLSIVIVNYNVKYYLEQCLDAVFKALKGLETEVFVVDNSSSDDSLEYLPPKFPAVKFIRNKVNVGFSRANNQAIEQSSGEYVLLLNPDTVVGEDILTNICRYMDQNRQVGALGVKMLDGYGRFLPESKRGFPSPWNSFTKMTGLSRLFPYSPTFGGYHLRYLDENKIHEVEVLSGAFLLLRRKAIEKTGSLDNSFFMYGEDVDLSYRIHKSGYSNIYFPEPILHYKGESSKKNIRYVKMFYEAMLIFFNKHYPNSNFMFKFLIRFAIVTCGFLSILKKKWKKSLSPNGDMPRKTVVFNTKETTYGEMIKIMDENRETDILYRIFHPDTGVTVDAIFTQLSI
jgi:GT2 family glycosyltransferase